MATLKEIASKVGVSVTTVSRVLNNDAHIAVNGETRRLIFETADKLHYKKKIIYPVIDNIAFLYWISDEEELTDIYFKSIRLELEKQAKQNNINIIRYKKNDGIKSISPKTAAFIAIGRFTKEELKELSEITPVGIFIDSSPDESRYDCVRPNLKSMVYQIVDFFISQGQSRIGLISGCDYDLDNNRPKMDIREKAFRNRMSSYGLLNEEYIFIGKSFSVNEGYRLAMDAMDRLKDNVPTAFCVGSDPFAIGALQAFNERGWAIPQRVSFFSINDIGIAKYVSPPLTTFHIDVSQLCSSALQLLRERIMMKRRVTKSVYINGQIIFRKSCL